jgi:hypothetical protein
LFQWSASFACGGKTELVIDVKNGNPRSNIVGTPDLLEFELPSGTNLVDNKMPWITSKAIGYSLRSHISPRGIEKHSQTLILVRLITSVLISFHFKRVVRLRVANGLGFDPKFCLKKGHNYLVGYFQSFRWPDQINREEIAQIQLKNSSTTVEMYRRLAKIEMPLVVHVRLGDYLAEGGFGVPKTPYYQSAILTQLNSYPYKKIWLFSDEPDKALGLVPKDLPVELRVISVDGVSPAETLEIMRMGSGYVIGNSTFSWWGAYLSYNLHSKVIYPSPWFQSLGTPSSLTPAEWTGLDAHY